MRAELIADTVRVGDAVKVFDVNGKRMGQPEGGWDGEVTKVGRKLVTIRFAHQTLQFRLEDGSANNQWGHTSFLTLPEAALRARLKGAVETLRERGVELRMGRSLPLKLLEALAKTCEQFDGSVGGGEG